MESLDAKKERAHRIVRALKKEYPEAHCRLSFSHPYELLVKTILSAQCTDERVNHIGKILFTKYKNVQALASVSHNELEKVIRSAGLFRNKARHIINVSKILIAQFEGRVPDHFNSLMKLPGVGRKTANVITGNAFGIPSLAVDTHVIRIANLLQLTRHRNPVKIENDLMEVLPKKEWISFSHRVSDHGRSVCIARRPQCSRCCLQNDCPSSGIKTNTATQVSL